MLFQLGICQMKVANCKAVNLEKAKALIAQARGAGADIAVLPEMFNCPYGQDYFAEYADTAPDGETFRSMAKLAREERIYIVAGSVPERDRERIYNSSFVFNREGEIVARHRKAHLFDITIPGKINFKESAVLSAGDRHTVFDTDLGRFGLAVCYDLRFPELFRLMVDEGADTVLIPAAFNMTTGPAHWETLLRARAIDNQIYVAAVSPARDPDAGYVAYGHSMLVDPWGRIIGDAGEAETMMVLPVDPERNREVRQGLPLLKHRRHDCYRVVR